MRALSSALPIERMVEVVRALYVRRETIAWPMIGVVEVPPFREKELKMAADRLKDGKASGLDGIQSENTRMEAEEHPRTVLSIMNQNESRTGEWFLPGQMTKGENGPIRKPDKSPEGPSSYRSICILDTMSKLLEYLLLGRIEAEIDRNRGLANNHFGFRKE